MRRISSIETGISRRFILLFSHVSTMRLDSVHLAFRVKLVFNSLHKAITMKFNVRNHSRSCDVSRMIFTPTYLLDTTPKGSFHKRRSKTRGKVEVRCKFPRYPRFEFRTWGLHCLPLSPDFGFALLRGLCNTNLMSLTLMNENTGYLPFHSAI
jgi:hypothetical protein